MKKRFLLVGAVLFVASVGVVSANFLNGPETAGLVFRVDGNEVGILLTDPSRNLMSVHLQSTLDPGEDLCAAGVALDAQAVGPLGVFNFFNFVQVGSDTPVAIYDTADIAEFLADPCGFLAGPKKLAEGTARYHFARQGGNLIFNFNGFLDLVGGGTAHYVEVQIGLFNGPFVVEDILLRPVPEQ